MLSLLPLSRSRSSGTNHGRDRLNLGCRRVQTPEWARTGHRSMSVVQDGKARFHSPRHLQHTVLFTLPRLFTPPLYSCQLLTSPVLDAGRIIRHVCSPFVSSYDTALCPSSLRHACGVLFLNLARLQLGGLACLTCCKRQDFFYVYPSSCCRLLGVREHVRHGTDLLHPSMAAQSDFAFLAYVASISTPTPIWAYCHFPSADITDVMMVA